MLSSRKNERVIDMIHKGFRKMSVCFLVGLSIVMFTACGGGNGNSQTWIKASVATG